MPELFGRWRRCATVLFASIAPLVAQAGARLAELPTLARARNERLRPKVEALLAPFLDALRMDYGTAANKVYLDKRIDEIAALGDSIVPALLERLTPSDDTPDAQNTAANAARILAKLGPGGFVGALLTLAQDERAQTRVLAITLLGKSAHPEAARYLDAALPKLPKSALPAAVGALRQLGHKPAAAHIAHLLATADSSLRGACVEFLTELGSKAEKPAVLQALRNETHDPHLPLYLAFLRKFGIADADAATALLPLLETGRISPPRQALIVHELSAIAPKGHDATVAKLRSVISGGELNEVGRACALTLTALGDKSGRKMLFEQLDEDVRKNPKSPLVLASRGDAAMAFEQWTDAVKDYRESLRFSRSPAVQKETGLKLARCYVRVKEFRRSVQALKEAGATKVDLDAIADGDPVFKQALADQADLRGFARDLTKS